ncbi:MAG: hypothetical protein LBB23_02935 [Rickettsiales bacterium]|nr:hypothetical protein [Rickettsiales bacterium]
MSNNDEILKFIQNTKTRLSDPARPGALRGAIQANNEEAIVEKKVVAKVHEIVQDLTIDKIVSDVYVISPAQLELVIGYVAKDLAQQMNVKALHPRILRHVDKSIKEALAKAKRMGRKK